MKTRVLANFNPKLLKDLYTVQYFSEEVVRPPFTGADGHQYLEARYPARWEDWLTIPDRQEAIDYALRMSRADFTISERVIAEFGE